MAGSPIKAAKKKKLKKGKRDLVVLDDCLPKELLESLQVLSLSLPNGRQELPSTHRTPQVAFDKHSPFWTDHQ